MKIAYVPPEEIARVLGLKADPVWRAEIFADVCRLNVLYAVAKAGSGHLGTSFSCLDLLSWLHLEVAGDGSTREGGDIVFSSKGHDVPAFYAVLTALGRIPFEKLHELRRAGGLPGHPDIEIPQLHTNTGSLGMGISKAKGIVRGWRLAGREGRAFVLTGDGELQEGQIWESLRSAATDRLHEITAVIDHNKLQSDTYVADVGDLGDLEAKFRSFGWHVDRVDGNDIAAIAEAFRRLDEVRDRPKALIADTVKGRGVSVMEHTLVPRGENYRFHSGAPAEEAYRAGEAELRERIDRRLAEAGQEAIRVAEVDRVAPAMPERAERLVAAYSRALVEAGAKDPKLVVLDADLVLDCGLIPFRDRFPDRFIECGIAEQDMVSQAGGLALTGHLPFVHSFASFLSTRPNEQIYNNATERTKIVYVATLSGVIPGGPGHSHQSVRDISALAATPGLVMLEPCTEREVELAVRFCHEGTQESCYLRLVSVPQELPFQLPADHELVEGRGTVLREGDGVVVIGYGPVLLGQAWKAIDSLPADSQGRVRLIALPWLNRVDAEWLDSAIAGASHVLLLDNHYVTGGQGEMLARTIATLGRDRPMVRLLGIEEIPAFGTNDEVLRAHGLDAAGIGSALTRLLTRARSAAASAPAT